MKNEPEQGSHYVRKVQEDTRRYVESLLKENETLRTLLARLESEKLALEDEVLATREQLTRHKREELDLQRQLAEIRADNQRFVKEYVEIEQHNSNLANLYVTSYRLHGTLNRAEVLEIMQEVLINLVGSEEFGIFEVNPDRTQLTLVSSFGIDEGQYQSIPMGSGRIGGAAEKGEPYFNDLPKGGKSDEMVACIPLKVGSAVTGVVGLLGLLPQKTGLEPIDHELFELLGTHAAMALYCTSLHSGEDVRVGATR